MFSQNGLEGARTKQIADEGGMAEAMIYRHFDSKEELFAAAIVAPFEQVVEHALRDAEAFPSISGHDRIEYSDRLHCEMHEAMRGLVPFLGARCSPILIRGVSSTRRGWCRCGRRTSPRSWGFSGVMSIVTSIRDLEPDDDRVAHGDGDRCVLS